MPEAEYYCGVDPGASSGGIAILGKDGTVIGAWAMREQTERDTFDLLKEFREQLRMIYIESVHSFPGQGVTSSFTFGMSYGFLRGVITALEVPFAAISPHVWQKPFGLIRGAKDESHTEKKARHKAKAQELFPNVKITHALADALLLAEFTRRTHSNAR